MQVVLRDTMFIAKKDTVLLLTEEEAARIKVNINPEKREKKFYDSLEERASNSKLGKNIYDLVVKQSGGDEKTTTPIIRSEDIFKVYEGYTINSILFKAVDLLEGSVIDTLQKATSKFGKFVNKMHRDTRAQIVNKNLLFEVGDPVDPYQLADNERVLRQFITLRDARIYLSPSKEGPKLVDVTVVTQDVASIGASGDYSSMQKFRIDVYDINILGYAKQLQISYFRNSTEAPNNGYEITYRDPNLARTFLQGELQYTNNYLRHRGLLALGRDFFTPDIKYAGGIELYRTHENYYFEDYDTLETPYTENSLDFWAGRSFTIKERQNIIFTTRANTSKFTDRPIVESDTNTFFYDRTLLLSSITFTERNFMKGYRILGFGKTEDVPVGGSVSLLFGKEFREFSDRVYGEINGTYGRYYPSLGYINASWTVASFFNKGKKEDGLLELNVVYFSDLLKVRKTQIRQFIVGKYITGLNRILDQTISLEGKWKDENGFLPLGNKRLSLSFETVYFLPWKVIGFQFAAYHIIEANLFTTDQSFFTREAFFPALRIGTRLLNDNLVFPSFEVGVGYYIKNPNYSSGWEIKVQSTIPDLFNTSQKFKPRIAVFN